ncbi:S8 family serine peptidase [Micromonospora soli]|uniref:S8 family serine peptidase n=1 Tax=Micromonospora sp. NBRC 110009 TaxID=3061627 RepID=UPI0026740D30|nr:S8 family serine peptidase [Micromonospora sp. NBRC 110009]WKU00603.1 S8 family serine peptidase [Micromonospora sp. NBRC 110009]
MAALALAVTGALVPPAYLAYAAQSPDHEFSAKQLPRLERPRDLKERDFDANAVLVRFKSDAAKSAKDRVLSRRDVRTSSAIRGTRWVKVHGKGSAVDLMRSLRKDPAVAGVSLDYKRKATVAPNDPAYTYGDQNYLNTVRLPQAWDRTKGSTSQVIAVVDTGVDVTHPDLTGRTVTGYNVLSPGAAPADDNGHGTMVAGIAAANTGNGIGVAGAAWTARVMPVKVLDAEGSGYDSDIAAGVIWAADHGAKIINMSLGGPGDDSALHDAIKYATGKGVVVVVAAGNDGDGRAQYPAAYSEVIAVAATDAAGKLTDFSSYGDWIDIAAPGAGIVSTGPGGDYYIGDGTSFSAPIVSGTAALVRTLYPSLTPAQVLSWLRKNARDAGPRGIDPYYGYGVLDAYASVGGGWAPEFPTPSLGANEPNDVPARATPLGSSVTGTIGAEGDVDWYKFSVDSLKAVDVTVNPPAYDGNLSQNVDPVLAVYDSNLRLVGQSDTQAAGGAEKVSAKVAAGTYYVSVRNYNGALDARAYTLSLASGEAPLFGPTQSTSTGSWPEAVAIGDVTGDGRNDVVMSTSYYFDATNDYKLFVFPQTSNGTLGTPVTYATGLQYSDNASLTLVDANGDGKQDVALATTPGVEIFRQTDAGTLESTGPVAGTAGSQAVTAGDMDGDGDADLVATATGGIKLLTQEADHTFTVSSVTSDSSGEIEVGDVDGDGKADVVGLSGTSVRVWHHTDAGWTRTEHATGSTWGTNGIEVADVNSDGKADVIASLGGNRPTSQVAVFRQNATGGLDAPRLVPVADIPEPIEAADVNGDGRTDVVTAHGGWNTLSVLAQQADGSLGAPAVSSIPYASHYNLQGLAVGDINGDKKVDAVLADYNSGLDVAYNGAAPSPVGEQAWVRGASPADFATVVPLTTKPSVTFTRNVDAASVTSSTVRLLNGRTGVAVAADLSVSGDTVTLTPTAALQDNTPYRIVVSGVKDSAGTVQTETFSTTFRTVDVAPPAVTGLKAQGAFQGATLSWTLPDITDLDQVIIRANAGTTAPSRVSEGIGVYAGAGSSATVTGLVAGTTYTFRVWVRDRSGLYSSAPILTMLGTGVTIGSSTTALTYGGAVTLTGKLVRKDTGAGLAGLPVQLYGKYKGASSYTLITTVTSGTGGALTYTHKPAKGVSYEWLYRGSSSLTGSVTPLRTVTVATLVTGNLSKTSFALGGTVTLSGSVSPSHAGQTVYLQRLVSGSWKNITSRTLSSSSTYSFSIKPTSRTTYYYRVYKPADTDHAAGYSPRRSFKVY